MEDNLKAKSTEVKPKSEKGIASEILGELKIQNKRMTAVAFSALALVAGIIILFIWYLNQYDFTGSIEQTGFYTFSDSNGNVISSDIDDAQMKEILEIINGKNKGYEKQD